MAARPPRPIVTTPPTTWMDIDLADGSITVLEFHDGVFSVTLNDERVLLSAGQMQDLVVAITTIGRAKGWIAEADGS